MKLIISCYDLDGEMVDSLEFDPEKDRVPEELKTSVNIKQLGAVLTLTQCSVPAAMTTERGIIIMSTDSHSADMIKFMLGHELGHVKQGLHVQLNDIDAEIAADKNGVAMAGKYVATHVLTLMRDSVTDTLKKCERALPHETVTACRQIVSFAEERIKQIS